MLLKSGQRLDIIYRKNDKELWEMLEVQSGR